MALRQKWIEVRPLLLGNGDCPYFLTAAAGAAAAGAVPASFAMRNFTTLMTSSGLFMTSPMRRYLPFTMSVGVPLTFIAMICESAWRILRSTLNDFDAATKSAALVPVTFW